MYLDGNLWRWRLRSHAKKKQCNSQTQQKLPTYSETNQQTLMNTPVIPPIAIIIMRINNDQTVLGSLTRRELIMQERVTIVGSARRGVGWESSESWEYFCFGATRGAEVDCRRFMIINGGVCMGVCGGAFYVVTTNYRACVQHIFWFLALRATMQSFNVINSVDLWVLNGGFSEVFKLNKKIKWRGL